MNCEQTFDEDYFKFDNIDTEYRIYCPMECTNDQDNATVVGSEVYHYSSAICRSA